MKADEYLKNFENLRNNTRLRSEGKVKIERNDKSANGNLIDISKSGLAFRANLNACNKYEIKKDHVFQITITPPEFIDAEPYTLKRANVIHVSTIDEKGTVKVGLSLGANPESSLKAHLKHLVKTHIYLASLINNNKNDN